MLTVVKQADSTNPSLSAEYSEAEIQAMQRAVGAIFARWGVSDADAAVILGGISPKTYQRWCEGKYGRANRDLADRMSYIIGIHRALRIIFAEPGLGYGWMNTVNAAFGNRTPVEILMRGGMEDLRRLRTYLDSVPVIT